MGLFDFLKVSVPAKKPPKTAQRMPVSIVEFDGRSFPLASLTTKGFVTKSFDGSLIPGQNARVTVRVDDAAGKFTFAATITVADTAGSKLVGTWTILPTEVDGVIRKYAQLRAQQAGK